MESRMETRKISRELDDLEWLAERIRATIASTSFDTKTEFGKITDNDLEVGITQQPKNTPGACRFIMTKKLADTGTNLVIIGMNPSWARDFEGGTSGELPESDRTAKRLYSWISAKPTAYQYEGKTLEISTITLINLTIVIDPSSKQIKHTLDKIDHKEFLKNATATILRAVHDSLSEQQLWVRAWGSYASWKKPFIEIVTNFLRENSLVSWDFDSGSGKALKYPPSASAQGILSSPPPGLVRSL